MAKSKTSMDSTYTAVALRLISFTQWYLTRRKLRRWKQKEKQKRIHPVLDWLGAFAWVIAVLFFVNQYFMQAYAIPSPSMEDSLLVGDRLFVDKVTFGPELLPAVGKLPALRAPGPHESVVFYNPEYEKPPTAIMMLHRIVYMGTLSLVNLDREPNGDERIQLLVKRAIGQPGERVRILDSAVDIHSPSRSWRSEAVYLEESGLEPTSKISLDESYHDISRQLAVNRALGGPDSSIYPPILTNQNPSIFFPSSEREAWEQSKKDLTSVYWFNPGNRSARSQYAQYIHGQYIPDGHFLPLGDNRDNSKDGRYFGPQPVSELLGRVVFIFWPLNRIGPTR